MSINARSHWLRHAARAGMAHLDAVRQAQGLPALPAPLHLGEILWGNVGAADRLDLTAIGPAVNLRVTLARRAMIAIHLTRMSTNRLADCLQASKPGD